MDPVSIHFDKGLLARHRHRIDEPLRQLLVAGPDIDDIGAGPFPVFIHGGDYFPCQFGLRFSAKASEPSWASLEVNTGMVISACFFQASSLDQS